MKKIILLSLILGLMMVATPTLAAEWYVDCENGTDNDLCSVEEPCARPDYVLGHMMSAGDTLNMAGLFSEPIMVELSGTADSYTTIQQWKGQDDARFSPSVDFPAVAIRGSYITLEGLQITTKTSQTGLDQNGLQVVDDSSNINIINNTVYDTGSTGIQVNDADNVLIQGNNIFQVGQVSTHASGVLVQGSNNTINSNVIYNVPSGITLTGANGQDFLLSNNIIYDFSEAGIGINSHPSAIDIYNNTIYVEDNIQSVYVASDYTGDDVDLQNNIFYGEGTNAIFYYFENSIDTFDSNYNLFYGPNLSSETMFRIEGTESMLSEWQIAGYDTNSLNENPLLTDVDNNVFNLNSNSPAIDSGTTLEAVTEDYNGDSRPMGQGYDIGADEYFILDAPTNLTNTSRGVYIATLGWDEVTSAESYNIRYRKATSDDYTSTTSETNSVNLTSLMNAGKYYWQVQSVSGDYTSDWSAEKRLITYPRKVKKAEVKIIEKTATSARIRIDSMAKRITGFNIIVAKNTGGTYKKIKTVKVSNKSAKTYTRKWIEDLQPDTKYRIRVKARRAIGSTKFLSASANSKYVTTLSE